MNLVKIGVIGCGSIAKHRHLPEYAANPNVQIVAVCDPIPERAAQFAEAYGATAYTDYKELLLHQGLDAVSVCTPNYLHATVTIDALNQGLHVLCEKPMATSQEEGEAMIAAAKKTGKYLMIGHNQRLTPAHQKGKEILNSGKLGKVLTFRTAFGHPGPEGWSVDGRNSWFFEKKFAFIGAMGDLGVHKTDLLLWLLGEDIVEVGAFVSTLSKENTDVDDNAVCILRTRSGAIGTLAASWSYKPHEDNSTIIYCENGILSLAADPVYQCMVQYTNGEVEKFEVGQIQTNESQNESGVISSFIRHILTGTEPEISGTEGLRALQVILAALNSSETGQITQPKLVK